MAADGAIVFRLDEVMAMVEDLMRIAYDLERAGDEVNAFLVEQVVNRLLYRALG